MKSPHQIATRFDRASTARNDAAFGWKEASRISMDGTDFGIDSNSDVGIM